MKERRHPAAEEIVRGIKTAIADLGLPEYRRITEGLEELGRLRRDGPGVGPMAEKIDELAKIYCALPEATR